MTDTAVSGQLPDHLWEAASARPKGTRFAQVPHWLLDAGISATAMKVWAAIARHINSKTRRGFPKRRTIAALIGMSLSAVDRALRELRRVGALVSRPRRRADGGQSSNEYLLLWQPLPELLTSIDTPTPLVTNDEGPSSQETTGTTTAQTVETAPPVATTAAATSTDTATPLVTGDEGVRVLIESYREKGGTRSPVTTSAPVAGGDGSAPPSVCPAHPHGTPEPCGPCAWYRRQREAFDAEQAAAEQARQEEAARQLAAERAAQEQQRRLDAIAACRECDHLGRRPDGRECDHRSETARLAAMSAIRAELAAKTGRRRSPTRWRRRRPAVPAPAPAPIPGVTS